MKNLFKYFMPYAVIILFSFNMGFYQNFEFTNFSLADIVPCELLTSSQVENVLPGHDGGFTAISGGSLMKGVDSYQCSYSDEAFNLLTVIVHIAADKESFDWIRPKDRVISEMHKDVRDLEIGDGGWLFGSPDDMQLKATDGYKVIELELMSENAGEKGDALVELASILLNKIK
ncbi:MAG: hypothetical protein EHM47_05770 [Ignavibacteriales bacterium]|nr:MAG: hypothetical protein EHM47_05770 [Ignavibacteriales bacterium]